MSSRTFLLLYAYQQIQLQGCYSLMNILVSQFCLKATVKEKEVLKFSESNVNFLDYYKIALVGFKSTKQT